MRQFAAQLKRELCEHPALYLVPAGIGAVLIALGALMLLPGLGADGTFRLIVRGVDAGEPGFVNAGVTVALLSLLPAFLLPLVVVVTFYLVDCLSAERRDRSILFFKSLPVSDMMTVSSKLATALLVAPAFAVGALIATQLATLVIGSVPLARMSGGLGMLWNPGRLLSVWVLAAYSAVAFALWHAPWFCYLAAISAWAKRATLLWVSAPFLLLIIERAIIGSDLLARTFAAHFTGFWLTSFRREFRMAIGEDEARALVEDLDPTTLASVWAWMDPVGLLTSPVLWIGLVVAGALTAVAVNVRRYRDDS